jgi:hypothetical protein
VVTEFVPLCTQKVGVYTANDQQYRLTQITIKAVGIIIIIIIISLTAVQRGLWPPPPPRGFVITPKDAPQSVGLLCTSDQLVAETST